MTLTVLVLLVILALLFDFLNGFHDAANSIATIVGTRVLTPKLAVLWAAFFNFIAFLLFGTHVAAAVCKSQVDPKLVDATMIAACLIAASIWDLVTWYWGLPTSSSHALIGGLVGAALAKAGRTGVFWGWSGLGKTMAFMVLAPVIGLIIALVVTLIVYWTFRRASPGPLDAWFRRGQLLSAALYSLGHGGNDAQKTMGIIALLLIAAGRLDPKFTDVPLWIVLSCHAAMGIGTLFGGWRIVATMGQKLTPLRPVDGFCAEVSAAATLFGTVQLGVPVSTTQTITGSIVGVGMLKRMSAVRWGVAARVLWAWLLTIPATAVISWNVWVVIHIFT